MTHICASELGHHLFRWWLIADSNPSHYLNQLWCIVNWTLRNKRWWDLNQHMMVTTENYAFGNVSCKTSAILFWPNVLPSLLTWELPHNGKGPISIHGIASNESDDPKRQTIAFANSGQNPCIKRWHNVKMELIQQHDNMDLVECNSKETGRRLHIKIAFPGVDIPMLKIRRSGDSLIFNMEIPILMRHTCIETIPRLLDNKVKV